MLTFRPHHFLCALCFQGAGYSSHFIKNFKNIMQILTRDETTPIKIVSETDSICKPCPHRQDKLCDSQEKINQLDQAHADTLQFKTHAIISWKNAKKHIQKNLTLEKFHRICEPCSWKSYGICEKILKDFLK